MLNHWIFLDATNFSSIDGFFDEVERKLTRDLSWSIGRNLDAFNDVLRGGFGQHNYAEPITLIWVNADKSRVDLGDTLFNKLIEIVKDHDHIDLKLQ